MSTQQSEVATFQATAAAEIKKMLEDKKVEVGDLKRRLLKAEQELLSYEKMEACNHPNMVAHVTGLQVNVDICSNCGFTYAY